MLVNPKENAPNTNLNLSMQFHREIRFSLRGIKAPKILDYGASRGSSIEETASGLSVGYNPHLTEEELVRYHRYSPWWFTNVYPEDETFDITIASFSLHHTGKTPYESISGLKTNTDRIALAEYDFTKASLDDFNEAFIAGAEQDELFGMFGGDREVCFAYHNKFGVLDYLQALTANGFNYKSGRIGEGTARFKFFLIGEKPQ